MSDKPAFSWSATRIGAFIRPAPSDDIMPMSYDNPLMDQGPESPDLSGANLQPALVDFLKAMDAKLETLISFVNQDRLRVEFRQQAEVVEISGEGLRLTGADALAEGDVIEAALVLSRFPLRLATVVGRITQRTHDHGRDVWHMEFTRVREADLEAIVAHVFKEERETIRSRKWSE